MTTVILSEREQGAVDALTAVAVLIARSAVHLLAENPEKEEAIACVREDAKMLTIVASQLAGGRTVDNLMETLVEEIPLADEDIIITKDQTNDERGEKIIEFLHGKDKYEVFHAPGTDGHPYVGYCNGEKSITADRADVAARGLQRKHIHGLPEGKLIDFTAAAKKLEGG